MGANFTIIFNLSNTLFCLGWGYSLYVIVLLYDYYKLISL